MPSYDLNKDGHPYTIIIADDFPQAIQQVLKHFVHKNLSLQGSGTARAVFTTPNGHHYDLWQC